MKKIKTISALKRAFSLVELMISLITISVIVAAMTPVITKKLSSQRIAVGSFGGGNTGPSFTEDCPEFENCFKCYSDKSACFQCIDGYHSENGYCVETLECVQSLIDNPDCFDCDGSICNDCRKTCNLDEYEDESSCKCVRCASVFHEQCTRCSSTACTECASGYITEDDGTGCKNAPLSGEKTFTTEGTTNYTIPDGAKELEIILVGGGAGGGGGTVAATKTWSFVESGNANITANANNKVFNKNTSDSSISYSNGIFSWTIPDELRGKDVKVSACGGGGGLGVSTPYVLEWLGEEALLATFGGNGGAYRNQNFTIPDWDSTKPLKIHLGGAGGGTYWKFNYSGEPYVDTSSDYAGCSLSGRVDITNTKAASCNATDGWGSGSSFAAGTWDGTSITCAQGGYDPFNDPSQGAGGGAGGKSGITKNGVSFTQKICNGGSGSIIGGGGAGASYVNHSGWYGMAPGGGGGGATMFYHDEFKNNSALIASGGGGGAGFDIYGESSSSYAIFGGGGGGGGGPNGGAGGNNQSQWSFFAGKPGGGSGNSDFGNSYCKGGNIGWNYYTETMTFNKASGGAMRISYTSTDTGASGGGAGAIAVVGKIDISNISDRIISVTVGGGGAGGGSGTNGKPGNPSSITIDGQTYIAQGGATGGNSNGTVVGEKGYITNGIGFNQITVAGYSTTDGAQSSANTGGAGGSTVINGVELCQAGGGGSQGGVGGNASGHGGCAGGGGGSGKAGGNGTHGYVYIRYSG